MWPHVEPATEPAQYDAQGQVGVGGKTVKFPSGWSDDRIKGGISDVATDPASSRSPGRNGREVVRGTRGGIDIEVIVEPNVRIVTGYPTNVPRNPR